MENVEDGQVMPSSDTVDDNNMPVPIENGKVLCSAAIVAEKRISEERTDVFVSGDDVKRNVKVNGDTRGEDSEGVDSSDCDNLVIDERPQNNNNRKRKLLDGKSGGFKGFKRLKSDNSNKDNEYEPPTNPYFNESLFELSALHHNKGLHSIEKNHGNESNNDNQDIHVNSEDVPTSSIVTVVPKKGAGKKNKKNSSPKLREYAQYLGLQPTVQFKCSKCGQAGFSSLALLNEHHKDCKAISPIAQSSSSNTLSLSTSQQQQQPSSTNFRVTRKVFLCSACGTYYENWNLFLHMREVHKRFICLYCLGMFSYPEKLSLHLTSKHNCVPNNLVSEENFFQVYKEPCFLMCCECEKVFSERDNFFNHSCQGKPNRIDNSENKNNKKYLNNQKQLGSKNNKQLKNKTFVEHITADTPTLDNVVESSNKEDKDKIITEDEVGDNITSERLVDNDEQNSNNNSNNIDDTKSQSQLCAKDDSLELDQTRSSPIEESGTTENLDFTNPKSNNTSPASTPSPCPSPAQSDDAMENDDKIENQNESSDLSKSNFERQIDENEYNHIKSDESGNEGENDSFEKSELDFPLEASVTDNREDADAEQNLNSFNDDSNDSINQTESLNEYPHEQEEDTRKVPKVTLKLPKASIDKYKEQEHEDSDDSDKLTMEVDRSHQEHDEDEDEEDVNTSNSLLSNTNNDENEKEIENEDEKENKDSTNITHSTSDSSIVVAGVDIPIVELELEQPLDKFDIQILLQKCLKTTVPTCVYCNHARRIAVNGKQLGLHAIAEHRFSAIVNSITAEELIPESFVLRIKECLAELQDVYFNLESTSNEEGITFSHVFECFQCRYSTTIHKELYLHNRKMHAKTILLCIMCKSNFYSYSELICHLCPGLYELNNDVSFRCCMCVGDDLPSAFRLMVHLRKRHHACDVCLELCHNQSRLSNHVWKHKLHHLCYRCGIAYRNKPDITKHLFWKHGTESVLCKKCLQKKWPHVYHFCIPPSSFTCEECNLNFTKAVSLKVHKRLHSDERPHACTFETCSEKFISKKLLVKHEFKHREPPEEILEKVQEFEKSEENIPKTGAVDDSVVNDQEEKSEDLPKDETSQDSADKPKPKPKVDVYDLPELNLSESDSSDSEDEAQKNEKKNEEAVPLDTQTQLQDVTDKLIPDASGMDFMENSNLSSGGLLENISDQPVPVLENIWDDFKNYQASKEKMEGISQIGMEPPADMLENATTSSTEQEESTTTTAEAAAVSTESTDVETQKRIVDVVMMDHDYSAFSLEYKREVVEPQVIERTQSMDHDYCSANIEQDKSEGPSSTDQPKQLTPVSSKDKKPSKISSSSDSSDSDSSSCTCGSNCSCSSSSGSSSSTSASSDSDSSSSEGRRKQQARRERRRLRAKNKNANNSSNITNSNSNKVSSKENKEKDAVIDVVATDQQPTAPVEQLIQESDLDTTETETDEEFYDKQPQKIANKLIAEKRKELLLLAGIGPLINGSVLESSRPSTPSLPETEEVKQPKKKSKNKKKKKKSKKQEAKSLPSANIPSTSYQYQYQPPIVAPLTITLPKNSPLNTPPPHSHAPAVSNSPIANTSTSIAEEPTTAPMGVVGSSSTNMETPNLTDSNLRASKRRRIPNKFYGYSSDDERDKHQPPVLKWRKADLPSPARPAPSSPMFVPPITIKTVPPAIVADESAKPVVQEMRVQQHRPLHAIQKQQQQTLMQQQNINFQSAQVQRHEQESSTESNGSSSDEEQPPHQPMPLPPAPPQFVNRPNQPPLYCYCRCPYDEVSEMIGCDSNDCMIEWFHFECVGIMVPPKGQWFCPDCRKKKQQQKKEMAQT